MMDVISAALAAGDMSLGVTNTMFFMGAFGDLKRSQMMFQILPTG
jgi:hypothetical protein